MYKVNTEAVIARVDHNGPKSCRGRNMILHQYYFNGIGSLILINGLE